VQPASVQRWFGEPKCARDLARSTLSGYETNWHEKNNNNNNDDDDGYDGDNNNDNMIYGKRHRKQLQPNVKN